MSDSPAAGSRISRRRVTAYDIYAKEDGRDYWRIAHAYLQSGICQADLLAREEEHPEFTLGTGDGTMQFTTLTRANPKRLVFRVETEGRRYLLKWMRRGTLGLGRLFPKTMGLTYYSRLFGKVRSAVDRGCGATQDYYLVAERPLGWFKMEVVAVLEYVDGEFMGYQEDYGPYAERLTRAVEELIGYGLTLDDLNPHNFIVSPDGIRVIDLSCRPPTRLNAVKMIMKMNAGYGLHIPVRGAVNRMIAGFLAARYRVRGWFGGKGF